MEKLHDVESDRQNDLKNIILHFNGIYFIKLPITHHWKTHIANLRAVGSHHADTVDIVCRMTVAQSSCRHGGHRRQDDRGTVIVQTRWTSSAG